MYICIYTNNNINSIDEKKCCQAMNDNKVIKGITTISLFLISFISNVH